MQKDLNGKRKMSHFVKDSTSNQTLHYLLCKFTCYFIEANQAYVDVQSSPEAKAVENHCCKVSLSVFMELMYITVQHIRIFLIRISEDLRLAAVIQCATTDHTKVPHQHKTYRLLSRR